jgi:hypothetical protein
MYMADAPEVKAVSVTPPKMEGRGKTAVHTPAVIEAIAKSAAKGWTSNNRSYNTRSAAQGALQTVKEAMVSGGFAKATSDLAGRVWQVSEDGDWVFAVGAKAAVR